MELPIVSAARLADELSRLGFYISACSIHNEMGDGRKFKYWVSRFCDGTVLATVTGFHFQRPETVIYGAVSPEFISVCTQYGSVSSGGDRPPDRPGDLADVSGRALVLVKWWFVCWLGVLLFLVWVWW